MATKQDRERREPEYFDPTKTATKQLEDNEAGGDLTIPEGAEFVEFDGAGTYEWDIIPFVVGKNAKLIHHEMKPGMLHYEFTYLRHAGVGPDEQSVACLRNWGEKCPLCDDASEFRKSNNMQDEENKKTFNSMKSKLRTIMKTKKPTSGKMRILAYSWHGFAKQLADKITGPAAERQGFRNFSKTKGGMTVSVKMGKTDMGKWLQAGTIELLPRDKDLDPALVDEWGSVDEWIIKRTAEEIIRIRDGAAAPDDDDKDDDRPARRTSRDRDDDDERPTNRNGHTRSRDDDDDDRPVRRTVKDDDDNEDNPAARKDLEVGTNVLHDDEQCKVVKLNTAGTRCDLEIKRNGKVLRSIDVADVKVDVPADEDEKPKRRGKDDDDDDRPARRTARDEDDDDRPQRRAAKADKDEDDDERGFKKGDPEDEDDDDKPKETVKRGPGRPRKS